MVCGCSSKPNTTASTNQPPNHQQQPGNELDTAAMLNAVNAVRRSGTTRGGTTYPPVPALRWNASLESAALRHTRDMANHAHFSHTGTDGSQLSDRVSDSGYSFRWAGENIALGYPSVSSVMEAWLNSPGHCANLMRSRSEEMGAARVGNYWTQDFAAPLSSNN